MRCSALALACLSLLAMIRPASAALTAKDLIVVFNQTLPESREVAEYYARKRHIPTTNLVGVALPNGETINRDRYETALLPPLRRKVTELRRNGRQPATVLMYGIPLKVGPQISNSQAWQKLINDKETEIAALADLLCRRLEQTLATDAPTPPAVPVPAKEQRSAEDLLKQCPDLIRRAAAPQDSRPQQATAEIASLLIRLTGLATIDSQQKEIDQSPDTLTKWKVLLGSRLNALPFTGITESTATLNAALVRVAQGVLGELRFWHQLAASQPETMRSAAVDSELSLLLNDDYQTGKWLPNPFLPQFDALPGIAEIRHRTLMVGRIDGSTPAIAKRLIDDALDVEGKGLTGIFYIDARGLTEKPGKKNSAYALYDEHLRKLRLFLRDHTTMQVVFDDNPALLAGPLPDAALYCGWYALGKYRDAFSWLPGSVGFHVASAEATTLHTPGSQVWCQRMLEEGVAATLGPVEEPYLQAFPLPDLFFPLLLSGKLPLLEVYYRTTPFLSWRLTLIGDPLYTPFANNSPLTDKP